MGFQVAELLPLARSAVTTTCAPADSRVTGVPVKVALLVMKANPLMA